MSDFPCNVEGFACCDYGGNHQIHHPPFIVKGYASPSVVIAEILLTYSGLMASTVKSAIRFTSSCLRPFILYRQQPRKSMLPLENLTFRFLRPPLDGVFTEHEKTCVWGMG